MVAIVRLNRAGQRISLEVGSDSGFYVAEHIDVVRVSDGIRSDAKCAPIQRVKPFLNIRFAVKQFIFIDQLDSPRNKVFAVNGQCRFNGIGIQVALRVGVMIPAPNQT